MAVIKQLNPWLKFGKRSTNIKIDTIVVHATAGSSVTGAIQTLRERKLSYHYIIGKDGVIWKCVPAIEGVAYHAGSSYGPQEAAKGISRAQNHKTWNFLAGTSVNNYTVGISLVNKNDGKDPYPAAQRNALTFLINTLVAALPSIKYLTTHYYVSPVRKTDPLGLDVVGLARETKLQLWTPN